MKIKLLLLMLLKFFSLEAQEKKNVDKQEIIRIETRLASDKMQGRAIFTAGIDSASIFIENEFKKLNLAYFKNLKNYRQEFNDNNKKANNVIGVILGKYKPKEFVIFSAHYDHLGIKKNLRDSVFNGANDDASGTSAVIALSKYFKELNNNERTLIFIAFTGEEVGGLGSNYFTENIDVDQVVAMFNIEMIGTESKWGKNSAYITGFDKSDLPKILQKNLKNSGSNFVYYPDPYPSENLFYRSDNARLASSGVPAHTISTSKMDDEPNYHQLSDDVSTINFDNMTEIIEAIAISTISIINGEDTPSRINKQ